MGKLRSYSMDYKGFAIHRQHNGGLVCLTDMWRAAGSVKSQKADYWLQQEDTCHLLLHFVLEAKPELKPILDRILEAKPTSGCRTLAYRHWAKQVKQVAIDTGLITIKRGSGKGCGTYAIDKLAIDYAKSLSPEFYVWVLAAVKERIEEDADPELGIRRSRQRAVKNWEKQGKSPEYIGARLDSIPKEDHYEAVLSEHGVKVPRDFGICKASGYQPIIGRTQDFRAERGLKKGQNCKDGMTMEELAATDFVKVLSAKRIKTLNPYGTNLCAKISHNAGKEVADLLNQ